MCFCWGKPSHIMHLCYKAKNKKKENVKYTKDEDKFAFATQHGAHPNSVCKWIMDSKTTKHLTLHKGAFDIYEVISSRNVRLADDSVAKASRFGFTIIEIEKKK